MPCSFRIQVLNVYKLHDPPRPLAGCVRVARKGLLVPTSFNPILDQQGIYWREGSRQTFHIELAMDYGHGTLIKKQLKQ